MNLRHTEERNNVRAESLRESQKQGVFVDESGQTNPQVSIGGTCRPATTGPLAGRCSWFGGLCKPNCIRRQRSSNVAELIEELQVDPHLLDDLIEDDEHRLDLLE
jgi:hypothetical protein